MMKKYKVSIILYKITKPLDYPVAVFYVRKYSMLD